MDNNLSYISIIQSFSQGMDNNCLIYVKHLLKIITQIVLSNKTTIIIIFFTKLFGIDKELWCKCHMTLWTTLEDALEYSQNGRDGGTWTEWQRKYYYQAGGDTSPNPKPEQPTISSISYTYMPIVQDVPKEAKCGWTSIKPWSTMPVCRKK